MNRYLIGTDGRTAFDRVKGRDHDQPVAEFGKVVHFKMLEREHKTWNRHDSDICGRWARGVWLGRRWDANENIIMTKFGLSYPRSIKRLVVEARCRPDLIEAITIHPWGETRVDGDRKIIFEDGLDGRREQQVQEEPDAQTRDIYLKRGDFLRFGWTVNCPKCEFMMRYPGKPGGPNHTTACRKGIIEKLSTTPEGRKRIEQAERRNLENAERRVLRETGEEVGGKVPEVPNAGADRCEAREDRLDGPPEEAQVRHEDEISDIDPNDDMDEPRMDLDMAEEFSESTNADSLADMTRELCHLAL